jgi:poly(3-hydroxybutyrate) depolymerase
MSLLTGQDITADITRSYTIHVPDDPVRAAVPAIVVFHGGGQDVTTIAARWGVDPPNPVPVDLADYLLVFPESDPRLGEEWVHHKAGDSGFPTLDLDFVRRLVIELTTRAYETASATFPTVSADPDLVYAAGFSNGGGMVWQLLNSALSSDFRGFAAVGKALDPEKARHYRCKLAGAGTLPEPAPVAYIHGTADRGYRPPFTLEETALGLTLPAFTVTEMLERNGIPTDAPATTRLIPGSNGVTEVVVQLFEGTEAFLMATVIHGGHNWPTPTTHGNPPVADHFDATATIVEFWRRHAGLF